MPLAALAAASTAASFFCCLVRAFVVVGKGANDGRQPSIQRPYLALAAVVSSHSTCRNTRNTLTWLVVAEEPIFYAVAERAYP